MIVWQKSSISNPTGNCVEVAKSPHNDSDILMRDSKDPNGAPLTFNPSEMDAFLRGVKAGEFDQYLLEYPVMPDNDEDNDEDGSNPDAFVPNPMTPAEAKLHTSSTVGEYALKVTGQL